MADDSNEKSQSDLKTQKLAKPHWDKMEKDELILQVKKQLMLLQKMKLKCDDFVNKNASLETALRAKDNDNAELKIKLDSVVLEKNDNSNKVSYLEEKIADLSRKNKNLEEKVDCMAMKQETANTTFQCLQEEIKKMQDKNNDLLVEVALLNAARDEALASMKIVKETITLESRKELDAAKVEFALAQEEKGKIQEEVDKLRKDLKASNEQRNTTKSDNKELEEKYAILHSQWKALDREYSSSKEDIKNLENGLSECNMALENVMKEKNNLMEELAEFYKMQNENAAREELALDHEEKAKILAELDGLCKNIETSEELRKAAESENKTLEEKYSQLHCQWEALDQEYSSSKECVTKLENDLLECNILLENVKAEKDSLNVELSELRRIRNENQALKTESFTGAVVEQAQLELEDVKEKLKAALGNGEMLVQKITDARLIQESLQSSNAGLKAEFQQLEEKYMESLEKLHELNISLLESSRHVEELSSQGESTSLALDNYNQMQSRMNELINNEGSLMRTIDAQQVVLKEIRQFVKNLSDHNLHQEGVDDREDAGILSMLREYVNAMNNMQLDHQVKVQLEGVLNAKINDVESHNVIIRHKMENLQKLLEGLEAKVVVLESNASIEKASILYQTEISEPSGGVSIQLLVETVDVCTEVCELIDKSSIGCQTESIPCPPEHNSDSLSSTCDGFEVQISKKKDASTETSLELVESPIICDGAYNEPEEPLLSPTQKSPVAPIPKCIYCEDSKKWMDEKERCDSMLRDYTGQLRLEILAIERSFRTILQCITETELDDNENSDINASLSQMKLLLDGITESVQSDEDMDISNESAHLYQVSEIVTLFESVLLLKVQKWTTCFQVLNSSMSGLEGRCAELQRICEDKEKSMKGAEELVSKYKSIAIKVKKEAAELKKKVTDMGLELDKTISEREHYKSQLERTSSQLAILNKDKCAAEDTAKNCEAQLSQEKEKHKKTLSKLEQALKKANQSNLMSLEFADYERLITDLNKQMELRNLEVSRLEKEAEFYKEKIQGFQLQMDQLENQKDQSEARGEQLKNLTVKLKSEISELRKLEGEWMAAESGLTARLESLSREVENYKIQLSDMAADNQKMQESKEAMQDAQQKAVRLLENRIFSLTDELQKVKIEYSSCQLEYESFKVRAHSVLKHKKSKSGASDLGAARAGIQSEDLNFEEKQRLEKAIEVLQGRVQELLTQLTVTRTELDTLQEEHDNLLQRHNSLASSRNEQDMSWKLRVERLQKELLTEQQEHTNTVRHLQQQQQQLSLSNGLKQQMDALRDEHKLQLEELQLKLDVSNDEIGRLQKEVTEVRMANSAVLSREDDLMVDFLNSERQEGEGSEFTENVFGTPLKLSISGTAGLVPFDQLLNPDRFSSSSVGSAEFEKLEGQLSVAAKRIEHLTEILHESEATNARMTEQTRVLKEEIRRLERNQEREQHLANMEYVKNIIVKFFSLPSGDERERLVPVLTTILRLSPDEERQVQVIAKGGVVDGQAAAGWSSYLPMWSRTT